MTRDQLIDYVERRYGLSRSNSIQVVDDCLMQGFTWLDIVRRLEFNHRFCLYQKAMQFA